jgi:perosamine synthetase
VQGSPTPEAHSWQAYVTLLPAKFAPRRAELIAELRTRGVEAQIGTYHQPLIRWAQGSGGHRAGGFPVTDDVAARALALPMHASVTRDDVVFVATQVRAVLTEAQR